VSQDGADSIEQVGRLLSPRSTCSTIEELRLNAGAGVWVGTFAER
jgi:hypothetical protein